VVALIRTPVEIKNVDFGALFMAFLVFGLFLLVVFGYVWLGGLQEVEVPAAEAFLLTTARDTADRNPPRRTGASLVGKNTGLLTACDPSVRLLVFVD
jgi:hypothetical protein